MNGAAALLRHPKGWPCSSGSWNHGKELLSGLVLRGVLWGKALAPTVGGVWGVLGNIPWVGKYMASAAQPWPAPHRLLQLGNNYLALVMSVPAPALP